jgi:hypothetical protein
MMPAFPPLTFRAAGFPQYGWKVGFPSGVVVEDSEPLPAFTIRHGFASAREVPARGPG